jgi:hypothetical protein
MGLSQHSFEYFPHVFGVKYEYDACPQVAAGHHRITRPELQQYTIHSVMAACAWNGIMSRSSTGKDDRALALAGSSDQREPHGNGMSQNITTVGWPVLSCSIRPSELAGNLSRTRRDSKVVTVAAGFGYLVRKVWSTSPVSVMLGYYLRFATPASFPIRAFPAELRIQLEIREA